MDLLPIQAVKPNPPSPGPVPTTDGEQSFSDLIGTLLAGLKSIGTGSAIGEKEHVGEEEENPTLGDQPDPLSVSDDQATVTPVVAPTFRHEPTTPVSDSTEGSVAPLVLVESRGTVPDQQASPTPHDGGPLSVAAPGTGATKAGTHEELIPDRIPPARVDRELALPTPPARGSEDAGPGTEPPGPHPDPTIESEPAARHRIAPESPDRQLPAETSPKEAAAEPMEDPDSEPVAPTRTGSQDLSPVTSPDSPQVTRIADTLASDNLRTATAELVERLTEWAERVETAQRSDAISLRLADADGEMLVRLSLREGRLELSVTRPGGETLPWLADQLGDALAERGFDMAEGEGRREHEDDGTDNRRGSHPGAKAHHRQRDGILM